MQRNIHLLMARYETSRRRTKCARSCTNPRDKGVLTASKFSAGFADRGPGNRRNSARCERGAPTTQRLVTPPAGAPLDSYLTFKYILCLLHFNTPVYSPAKSAASHPFPSLPRFPLTLRFARARIYAHYSERASTL